MESVPNYNSQSAQSGLSERSRYRVSHAFCSSVSFLLVLSFDGAGMSGRGNTAATLSGEEGGVSFPSSLSSFGNRYRLVVSMWMS